MAWRISREAGRDLRGGGGNRAAAARNEKLTAELTRTKAALEVVGKAHALLELLSESADSGAKRQK